MIGNIFLLDNAITIMELDEMGKLGTYDKDRFPNTDLEKQYKINLRTLDWPDFDGDTNDKYQLSISDLFQEDNALTLPYMIKEYTNNYIDQNKKYIYFSNPGESVNAQPGIPLVIGDNREKEDKFSLKQHGEIFRNLNSKFILSQAKLNTGKLKNLINFNRKKYDLNWLYSQNQNPYINKLPNRAYKRNQNNYENVLTSVLGPVMSIMNIIPKKYNWSRKSKTFIFKG
ncbi:unnamed protein product [Gordionus sp. m RMFG-2023]